MFCEQRLKGAETFNHFDRYMELIRRNAYARAGLIGNPSDGYNGKTISVIVRNYRAQVSLYEWDRIEIVPSRNDDSIFNSLEELLNDVRLHGYYGGIRLLKASIKGFADYCIRHGIQWHDRKFSIRYESNIPRQVGMAGSSAIVVATIRALMDFYGVEIPQEVLPSLVLSIEKEQLGISAGLQDRVIQVYEGCVFMDFSEEASKTIDGFQCGQYEPLDPSLLPMLYVAFSEHSEPTEVFHNNLRFRYENGEKAVLDAMFRFADLAFQAKDAILAQDERKLAALIDANFDLRRSICKLPPEHIRMVETARKAGASAKFAGSGGAIIGTVPDEKTFKKLKTEMTEINCVCFLLGKK